VKNGLLFRKQSHPHVNEPYKPVAVDSSSAAATDAGLQPARRKRRDALRVGQMNCSA
jgi:hypothetical protein